MNSDLIDSYRYHRRFRPIMTAGRALEHARLDMTNGKRRYPCSLCNPYNPRFAAYGERHLRWIENWQRAGLRFVGYADELGLRSIDHKGWFTGEFQDEVYRGTVYQLPTRSGESVYVYGYDDPCNEGAALLSFDWTADKDDAARWADRIAERAAEEQREYSEVSDARLQYDAMADEAGTLRSRALKLLADPDIDAATARWIREIRADICELYRDRAKLASDYDHHEAWNH